MEITLYDALKKFFIKDKFYLLLIIIFSFALYPFIEKKYFNHKNIDYLLVRIDLGTFENAYAEIRETPIKYLHRLESITSREKSDRNQDIDKLDCRGFVGPRKYEVDCHFFIKLNYDNRSSEVKKYINYIKQDFRNFQLKTLSSFIEKLKISLDTYNAQAIQIKSDTTNKEYANLKSLYERIYSLEIEIKVLKELYSTIKNEETKSLIIDHKIIDDQKNTLFNSILIFVMLSFINFCRVVLIN